MDEEDKEVFLVDDVNVEVEVELKLLELSMEVIV